MKSEDMIELTEMIRKKHRNQKVALFLDNCKCHKSIAFKEHMEKYKHTKVIYNLPYSPQYNGIEYLWGDMKLKFRKLLTEMKI